MAHLLLSYFERMKESILLQKELQRQLSVLGNAFKRGANGTHWSGGM